MNDFNIKKFLTENKMTRNSRLLKETSSEDFYVVNKKLNDKNLSSGSPISYDERPFAQKFNSWEEALKNATPEDEIETPEGDVYGFEDGKWVVVFT